MSLRANITAELGDLRLDVGLSLPTQGVTALFGPSGAGKTSVLRAVAGLDRYPGSSVHFGETPWQDEATFVPTHQRGVGLVFQQPHLFPHLNVSANLHFAQRRRAPGGNGPGRDELIEVLGLGNLLSRDVARLSGGEQQRVALARALLSGPRLLLLDEPLSALDTTARGLILPYLEALFRQLSIPVVYVSHNLDEVARLADHLVLLDAGRVRTEGSLADVIVDLDQPLAHGDAAEVVWPATIQSHDVNWSLTTLETDAGPLQLPGIERAVGQAVRLRIAARDVSLALSRSDDSSILNRVTATVAAVSDDGPGQAMVKLDAGGLPLLARLTRRSVADLELAPGANVFAQVKSVALLS